MNTIKLQISNQYYELLPFKITPKRVKFGLREQAIMDAPPGVNILGIQPPYITNQQTGQQTLWGLEILRVNEPSCVLVEG